MSDSFRNIVFVLVAGGCLLVTALNNYVAGQNSEIVEETFHSLMIQQDEANQIEVAQSYGMKMGQIAFYEAVRAGDLEVQKDEAAELIAGLRYKLDQMELQAEMWDFSLEVQGSYIQQLIAFIESKGLESPAPIAVPDPRHIHPTDPYPDNHESLLDEDGHPTLAP